MDFLDPNRERTERRRLYLGYVLVALAIAMATILLIYNAYGFSVNRQGQVIQNGIVFASSQPSGAQIFLNGKSYKNPTNTKMELAAGTYQMRITEKGYRDWQRTVTVQGGDVQRFDYPFLFPADLKTAPFGDASSASSRFVSQSPDKRWVVQDVDDVFRLTDLKNPAKPVVTTLALPEGSYTTGTGAQDWQAVEWSSDNRHLLLRHTYQNDANSAQNEYVLFDRQDAGESRNLTTALDLNASSELSLFDKKATRFYVFDTAARTLTTASTDDSLTPRTVQGIRAFKAYGDDTLLYVTSNPPTGTMQPAGKVTLVLEQSGRTYGIRSLPADAPAYSVNLATYDGDWYIAAAASNDAGTYLYKNPQSQRDGSDGFPAPYRLLTLKGTSHLSFSSNTQFLAAENGQQFVIYDAENVETFRYTSAQPLDPPQTFASWMDGNRLMYVSGGKLVVFDYDYRNIQTLQPASPAYLPMFSANYRFSYTETSENGAGSLTSTPLTLAD